MWGAIHFPRLCACALLARARAMSGKIFKSTYPDVAIPSVSLHDFIFSNWQAHDQRTALVDGLTGRTLSYRNLRDITNNLHGNLVKRGLKQGEVVAIFSQNHIEYPTIFLATIQLGGTVTTLNPTYTPEEVAFQLNDSSAKYLFTLPALLDTCKQAKLRSPKLEQIIVIGSPEFNAMLTEPSLLPYSSGTTGLPKGVMLRNIVANISQIKCLAEDWTERDVLIAVLPFYHIYGMVNVLFTSLLRGSALVVFPRFDLEAMLAAVQKYKITRMHLILLLAKSPIVDNYNMSTVKWITTGAAPVGEEVAKLARHRTGANIKQGYGLTESSPLTHGNCDDPAQIKIASIGKQLANQTCKIIDENGTLLGENQLGEICVRSPSVMLGYLNNPQATARTIDPEGYLHTGDIGHVDSEGYFYISDRVKELIKFKGLQVAPAELEALLLTHAGIADAAVVPYPDQEAGEIPKAFVVLKPGAKLSPEEVMQHVRQHVAPHKRIRMVEFVDAIPKTASGKILRRELRDRDAKKLMAKL